MQMRKFEYRGEKVILLLPPENWIFKIPLCPFVILFKDQNLYTQTRNIRGYHLGGQFSLEHRLYAFVSQEVLATCALAHCCKR